MRQALTKAQVLALRNIQEQLRQATDALKCHRCGCFQQTVNTLAGTAVGQTHLAALLAEARAVLQSKRYECLGCPVCYPAVAINAFSAAFSEVGATLDLCPTEAPEERQGWPPLAGAYHVLRYRAPVAVCTLNSDRLALRLRPRPMRPSPLLAPYTRKTWGSNVS